MSHAHPSSPVGVTVGDGVDVGACVGVAVGSVVGVGGGWGVSVGGGEVACTCCTSVGSLTVTGAVSALSAPAIIGVGVNVGIGVRVGSPPEKNRQPLSIRTVTASAVNPTIRIKPYPPRRGLSDGNCGQCRDG